MQTQEVLGSQPSTDTKFKAKKRTFVSTIAVSLIAVVLAVFLYVKPNAGITTFLGLVQNKNASNSVTQGYQPVRATEYIDLSLQINFEDPKNPTIQLVRKQKGTLKGVLSRSVGNYYVELYDNTGKWVDAVFFSASPVVRILSDKDGAERPAQGNVKVVTRTVRIPYIETLGKVIVRSVENSSVAQEIPLNVKNDTSITTAAIDATACGDALYQGDGQGHFVIQSCANFDKYPAIAGEFKELYLELKENFPELVYFPINEIFLGNTEELAAYCDNPGAVYYGCTYEDGRIGLNVFTPFFFKNVGAHELGHVLLFYNTQMANMSPSLPAYAALKALFNDYTAFINTRYGASRNCQFTFENTPNQNTDSRKQNNNLFSEWYAQNRTISPTNFLDCTQFFCPWNAANNTHPVLKTFEPYSERPKKPGSVTNYGDYSYHEKFAEVYASLYKGLSGIGIPRSLDSIFKIFDPNQATCSAPGVDCGTDALKRDVQILGNFCLVEDADHDGVVDSADTCAPKVDCPDNANRCYNPSQLKDRGCGLLTERVQGPERYDTAIEVSKKVYPVNGSAQAVMIASGENYPDALAASLISYQKNAPILLTHKNGISTIVLNEIQRVLPRGGKVYISGGPAAVSETVTNSIKNFNGNGYQVERLAGQDRIDTALEIAKQISGNPDTFFITTSSDFPEPLAVSAISAQQKIPLLLYPVHAEDKRIINYLSTKTVHKIYIIGGYGSISQAIENELNSRFGNVERISSSTSKYDTSVAIAQKFFPQKELNVLMFATGDKYPDALSSSVLAARNNAPLVLVPAMTFPKTISDFIASWGSHSSTAIIFGGTAAVGPNNEYDINDALRR